MTEIVLYYNPRCGTCRSAKEFLEKNKFRVKERRYLDEPPQADEVAAIIRALGKDWTSILRTKEPEFEKAGLKEPWDQKAVAAAIAEAPILLQRPIAVASSKAIVARPAESLEPWLKILRR